MAEESTYFRRFRPRQWVAWASGTEWNWAGCDTLDYMKLDPVYRPVSSR